jgi:hypothetical protein
LVKRKRKFIGFILTLGFLPASLLAQERIPSPYFVPYDHYMEELGALQIKTDAVRGQAHDINTFVGDTIEFEYGARKWWSTELYLDSQHTQQEGGVFTGFRFENRFRLWLESHKVNPVLYIEYEHLTAADKVLKEIVGFDGKKDLAVPNSVANQERLHEIETRLILSSELGEWNITGNFMGEKNLKGNPWEFGYATGLSRPLAARSGKRCGFCAERFSAGVELYGGSGTWRKFTLRNTSQYIAPVFLWTSRSETAIHVSVGWGLTDESARMLLRVGVSQELDDIGSKIGTLFGKHGRR